jgi:hypothetical protein
MDGQGTVGDRLVGRLPQQPCYCEPVTEPRLLGRLPARLLGLLPARLLGRLPARLPGRLPGVSAFAFGGP